MRLLCFTLFALLRSLTTFAVDYVVSTDIPYSPRTDVYSAERCKLDIYHPTDATGLPVVVWFHGGGLTAGQKELPQELQNSGVVIVGVNYRLMPRAEITDCIERERLPVAHAAPGRPSGGQHLRT